MDLLQRFAWWRFGKDRGCERFVLKHLREGGCADEYQFVFHRGAAGRYVDHSCTIYCDAEYTILLKHIHHRAFLRRSRGFLACIGFNVLEPGVVQVVQIQGVRGKEGALKALRWDRMLLEMLTVLARESGFREIRVQASRYNHWGQGKHHLRYDVLPKRMGFTPGLRDHTLQIGT